MRTAGGRTSASLIEGKSFCNYICFSEWAWKRGRRVLKAKREKTGMIVVLPEEKNWTHMEDA